MSEDTKTNTSLIAKSSKLLDPFEDLEKISKFAASLTKSELAKPLRKAGADEAEVSDIIAAISIGLDIGIPPMSAISLGKVLNAKSYISALKGKSMGIDPITAIHKIHNIETQNGSVLYTSVDIISKTILDTGTRFKIIRDYEATPKYYDLSSGIYIGHHWKVFNEDGNIKPLYFLWKAGITADEVSKAVNEGKIVIKKGNDFTFVTSIHFIRPDKNIDEIFNLSTQEMIDADLLKGYHSSLFSEVNGKQVPLLMKGKLNWNNNTPQMLRNRCISIPGRIIVADRLQGIYTNEEVMDMPDVKLDDYQEVEIVK